MSTRSINDEITVDVMPSVAGIGWDEMAPHITTKDVGVDNETMVSDDYAAGATDFRGEIVKVTVAQQ